MGLEGWPVLEILFQLTIHQATLYSFVEDECGGGGRLGPVILTVFM